MESQEQAGKNLARKLVKVMGQVSKVAKNGFNAHHKYSYVTEADILESVREALLKENVFIYQSVVGSTKEGNLTTVSVRYTFVDADSGESHSVVSMGQGTDASDKGAYKALTGANKYFIMKNFLIPTGDDPESTDDTGKSTQGPSPTAAAQATKAAVSPIRKVGSFNKTTKVTASGDDGGMDL